MTHKLHCFWTFALLFLFNISSPADLTGDRWEREKILRDLQDLAEEVYLFSGGPYTMFDSDLPEHQNYYANLRTMQTVLGPLWKKLKYELTPRQLGSFRQFQDRINTLRQYGIYKKEESDYALLYARLFYAKTKPGNPAYQRYYEEDMANSNGHYTFFCDSVNHLENETKSSFLKYYQIKVSGYTPPLAIYDHGLVQLANGHIEEAMNLADAFVKQINEEKKDLKAEELLNLGITFIEAMEYSKALDSLNASITKNPSNKEAHFQRAIAYLETGGFAEALKDFQISEKNNFLIPIAPKTSSDFSEAFMNGLVTGSSEALLNFLPSLYSFAYANVFHPIDSLTNYINACYTVMEATAEYLKEVDWSLQGDSIPGQELATILLEPGLKRLYEKMDGLTPAEQGELLGHAIGAYGTDFVAGIGLMKGLQNGAKLANACKTAREAGRVYELETLAQSGSAAEAVIAEAAERLTIRETIVEGAKTGRIVTRTANAQCHIMQEKHAWDKLISLTGNVEQDFKTLAAFLEEHNIKDIRNMQEVIEFHNHPFGSVSEYRKIINGHEIQVFFENYEKEGLSFLKNGWVVTKNKG